MSESGGGESIENILPSDKELYERSKDWSSLFEKYKNSNDDEAILVREYSVTEMKESEESIDSTEFEDNAVSDDPDFDLKDVLNETKKVIARRQERWNECGIDRIMDSFCYNKITEKVGGWLKNNTEYLPTKLNKIKTNSNYANKIKINEKKIIMEHGSDQNSLDSVDTAKYILSNRRRRKSKVTMTIKKYCYSAKMSKPIPFHIDNTVFSDRVRGQSIEKIVPATRSKSDSFNNRKTASPKCSPAKNYKSKKSKSRRYHALHLSRSASSSSSSTKPHNERRRSSRMIKSKERISHQQASDQLNELNMKSLSAIFRQKNIKLNDTDLSDEVGKQKVEKAISKSASQSKTNETPKCSPAKNHKSKKSRNSRDYSYLSWSASSSCNSTKLRHNRGTASPRIIKRKKRIFRQQPNFIDTSDEVNELSIQSLSPVLPKKNIKLDETFFSDEVQSQAAEKAIPESASRPKADTCHKHTTTRLQCLPAISHKSKKFQNLRQSPRINKPKMGIFQNAEIICISSDEVDKINMQSLATGLPKIADKSNRSSTQSKEVSSDFSSIEGGIINSTALKSQRSMIDHKVKFESICEHAEDGSICSNTKRMQSVVLYSPNKIETPNRNIKNGKLQVTEKYLEENLGTAMKNKLLRDRKTFNYECNAESKLIFIPPMHDSSSSILSSSDDDILEDLARLRPGLLVEAEYVTAMEGS